ncbi:MAG: hypothetical protein AB1696_16850 [Planctomycetota bacterium]
MTQNERIRAKALELLEGQANGMRYSVLMRAVKEALPDANENTIHGSLWNLDVTKPEAIYKPARGLLRHVKFRESEIEKDVEVVELKKKGKVSEDDFYDSFADWIKNELEECTKAISLGGNRFKDKWGTPDVVGVRAPRPSDILKLPAEIVSAEIKLDTSSLITAFGQACSYRLFSHKVYLVVPNAASEADIARLDALCRLYGIGLILFDAEKPKDPGFEIRVRATKHEPDMFYVNKNLKAVEDELF